MSRDLYSTHSPPGRFLLYIFYYISVSIALLTALLGLTGFGLYAAFGPPSRDLDDPFDDHDD